MDMYHNYMRMWLVLVLQFSKHPMSCTFHVLKPTQHKLCSQTWGASHWLPKLLHILVLTPGSIHHIYRLAHVFLWKTVQHFLWKACFPVKSLSVKYSSYYTHVTIIILWYGYVELFDLCNIIAYTMLCNTVFLEQWLNIGGFPFYSCNGCTCDSVKRVYFPDIFTSVSKNYV